MPVQFLKENRRVSAVYRGVWFALPHLVFIPMYTVKEIERYTKQLAKLGITGESEVHAVLEYIHKAVCIAIQEIKAIEKENGNDKEQHNAA